jgi:hypothetical protein
VNIHNNAALPTDNEEVHLILGEDEVEMHLK